MFRFVIKSTNRFVGAQTKSALNLSQRFYGKINTLSVSKHHIDVVSF